MRPSTIKVSIEYIDYLCRKVSHFICPYCAHKLFDLECFADFCHKGLFICINNHLFKKRAKSGKKAEDDLVEVRDRIKYNYNIAITHDDRPIAQKIIDKIIKKHSSRDLARIKSARRIIVEGP